MLHVVSSLRSLLSLYNSLVPEVGVEPTRPNGHMALNHACLPISAHPLSLSWKYSMNPSKGQI